MRRFCWPAICVAASSALLGLACSRHGGSPPESKDPAVYARGIKQLVTEFLDDNRSNPADAPKQAAVLLETLEVHPSQPVGDHGAIYAELTERCKELTTAKGADITKKLNDMAALIKKLP
ncbi:MAG: hypothetical protein L0Y71_06015 [Gemmataceae bacterium]|nr:hypothetical protein [Gemmataceae bacterium]